MTSAPRTAARPTVRRLTKRTKQTLDILHYVTSVGWAGIGLCQLTLNVVALTSGDALLRHAAHEITHTFDRALLIALGNGSLITGVLLGLKTKWGLVRYWWVFVKLLLTLGVLIFGGVWMGAWIGEAIVRSAPPVESADAGYIVVRNRLMSGSISNVVVLLCVTVISVVKPWGRTPFGRRR
jgi:hypothetical protein